MRPRLLDLFCGAGGAAVGYHRAGFDVVGVDIKPQPRYPFMFVQGDALEFAARNGRHFDAIHASPPCQRFTVMQRVRDRLHPDLVSPTRELLHDLALPFVIENVPGAPLVEPVMLCGTMFPGVLKVYRHRLFETSFFMLSPAHPKHTQRFPQAGYGANAEGWMSVAGHVANVAAARTAMGIDWMTQTEIAQAIPPAYTEFIGTQLLRALGRERAA